MWHSQLRPFQQHNNFNVIANCLRGMHSNKNYFQMSIVLEGQWVSFKDFEADPLSQELRNKNCQGLNAFHGFAFHGWLSLMYLSFCLNISFEGQGKVSMEKGNQI